MSYKHGKCLSNFVPEINKRGAYSGDVSKQENMKKTNVVLEYYLSKEKGAKLNAAKNIKSLLAQIDGTAERVPENNYERLKSLLLYLKGYELSSEETEIIKIIANS